MATIKKAKTGTSVPKTNSVSKNIGNLNKAKNGKPVKKAFLGAALPIAMKALPMLGGMLGGRSAQCVCYFH